MVNVCAIDVCVESFAFKRKWSGLVFGQSDFVPVLTMSPLNFQSRTKFENMQVLRLLTLNDMLEQLKVHITNAEVEFEAVVSFLHGIPT